MIKTLVKGQVIKERMVSKVKGALISNKGEGYVDSGVKVLMAVVIGALLLGGLYLLFKDNILPTLSKKITEMFNFKG